MERMRNKHTDGFMIEAWKNLINEKHFTLLVTKYKGKSIIEQK